MNLSSVQYGSLPHKKLLLIAGTGWLFDAMDVGLLSFIMTALTIDWQLTPSQAGLIGSVNSIGMAIGAFVFGIYADKKGRKSAFIITLLLFSIASGLSALSWSLTSFLILRFFIGVGLGGELPVAATLVSESAPSPIRGRIVVLLESFWAVGWLFSAIIAFFLIPLPAIGWRGAMVLCALPAFYTLYLRTNLPDSPLSKLIRRETIWNKCKVLWVAGLARRTATLWIVWFCVVFSYYGMFLWLPSIMVRKGFDLVESFGYVLLMTLAQLPGYFSAAWLIERIGRRWVLIGYLMGTLASGCCFGYAESVDGLMISGALLSFFNLGAWGALYAYTPEQYPTHIRATGAGMAAAVGRIGGILGPLLVGSLVSLNVTTGAIFTIFSGTIFIAVMVLFWLGVETKQTDLL